MDVEGTARTVIQVTPVIEGSLTGYGMGVLGTVHGHDHYCGEGDPPSAAQGLRHGRGGHGHDDHPV